MAAKTFENTTIEIEELKSTLLDLVSEDEIITHKFKGSGSGNSVGKTLRIAVTKDGRPSVMGMKLIRMAMMGKSWRYMEKVTGINHRNLSGLFQHNTVIQEAVLDLQEQVVTKSKSLIKRKLYKVTENFVRIATGDATESADRQKVQLDAIRELFNRLGFLTPEKSASRDSGDYVIRVEGGEGKQLAVLMERRQGRIAAGDHAEGTEEGKSRQRQEGSSAGDLESESDGDDGKTIEGEYRETS